MIKLFRNAESVKVTFALPADEAVVGCSVVGDFNGGSQACTSCADAPMARGQSR